MAGKQPSSIREENNQDHPTSNRDTTTSANSTLGISMGTPDISNNNIIEISIDNTKCESLKVDDETNNTSTLPTTIDIDDQTTISSMTPNNYNY